MLTAAYLLAIASCHAPLQKGAQIASCDVATAPAIRISASVGSDSLMLNDVTDAALLPDGRIVAVNRGNREVLIFDSRGLLEARFGREGEGPGAFLDPIEVTLGPGDSISVWDWEIGRITVLDPRGTPVRTIRVAPPLQNPTGFLSRRDARPFAHE